MKKPLCLHGAHSSASNFKVQMHPLVEAVRHSDAVEFKWLDGTYSSTPPPAYEHYFGAPPLYRFLDINGVSDTDDMLWKIRDMSNGRTAEDSMRQLGTGATALPAAVVRAALDNLFKVLEADPEIDAMKGILGYSEGALMASSLILEESRRLKEEGRPRQIKYGIFLGGWPPLRFEGDSTRVLLADECEDVIDVPTLHIIGCNDPYIHGALSLYNMCDEDIATLFDHGKGHTVPRDQRTIKELAVALQALWNRGEF